MSWTWTNPLMPRCPKTWPVGRLSEVRARSDADLIAYSEYDGMAKLRRYNSRAALESFCKSGSAHHALIKTPVHHTMLHNRNVQRETADSRMAPGMTDFMVPPESI